MAKCKGHSLSVSDERRFPLIMRAFLSTATFSLIIAGIQFIPLLLANVLVNTSPFFAVMFAWAMLGDRLNTLQWAALITSFGGILLIYFSTREQEQFGGFSKTQVMVGCVLNLMGAATFGCQGIYNRLLTGMNLSVILLYTGIVVTVVMLVI